MRLLKLPPEIQTALKTEEISMGHARALLSIDDLALQIKLFKQTKEKEMSVRALEKLIQSYKVPAVKKSIETKPHPEVLKMERRLAEKIGVKPTIKRNDNGKGEIKIGFDSDETLNAIIDALLD